MGSECREAKSLPDHYLITSRPSPVWVPGDPQLVRPMFSADPRVG
jgi:hypothetical protein